MSSPAERYAAARRRTAHPTLVGLHRRPRASPSTRSRSRRARRSRRAPGVLVCAPTGAGKTVVGEFAIHKALAEGRKAFYTTPIKALSNQKYADLVERYGAKKVGLLTGDNAVNGDAPVVVMTTEVLRNMLYADSPAIDGLGYVVMDEVHYLADRFRGAVWEEVIIHLPQSVTLVSLSATVSNAEEFGDWLVTVRGAHEGRRQRGAAGPAVAAHAGRQPGVRPVLAAPGRARGRAGRHRRASRPPASAAPRSSTPSWCATSASTSGGSTPGTAAGPAAPAATTRTGRATGRRRAPTSSTRLDARRPAARRSPSCSAATAATPPSTSACCPGCG